MAVAILTPAIAACSLLERFDSTPEPTDGGGPGASTGTASPATDEPLASAPIATGPIPIPDPLNPLTHPPGEVVQVPGATIVYLGLTDATAGVIARFQVSSGSLEGSPRLLTPDGRVLEMDLRDDVLESAPFQAPTGVDATLTLIVGEALVVFELGPRP
jgi:hypothetical protein